MFKEIINFTSNLMGKKNLPWAKEIDALADLAAIEYATKQLNLDYNKALFDDHAQLEAFFAMDEKTHTIAERIAEDYIETDHIDLDYAAHIANIVFLYHRQIYNIYLKLIKNPAPVEPPVLLTMLLRATNSATEMVKWRYYQYQSMPSNIWLQLSKLYRIAEEKFLQNEEMQLYLGAEQTTEADNAHAKVINMNFAYMQACMLGTLETLNFKPLQIKLVCKLLSTWSSKLSIKKEYDEKNHLFYVDTAQNAPAKRIRKFKPSHQQRYWSLDVINAKIELCLSLLEFNIAPKQQKIIEITNQKHALVTLSALRSEWSRVDASRQRRSAERISTQKSASVMYGFENTCDRIKQADQLRKVTSAKETVGDAGVQKSQLSRGESDIIYVDLGEPTHSSTVVDESCKGLGLHVRKPASELSIGMLVSVYADDQSQEGKLGVLRNIKPVANKQFHIGVELLSRAVFYAEAENITSQLENTASANEFHHSVDSFSHDFTRFTCLFLPKAFSSVKEDTLIMPRHQFNKKNLYGVQLSGKNLLINVTETLEQHENWVRVAYKSAEKEQQKI